jgi:urea ABC transporter permease protein UrtC
MGVTSRFQTRPTPSGAAKLVGVAVLLLIPLVTSSYRTSIIATYITFAILAVGIDLVWGYTGMLTLGHAAFFGAGGYTTAKLLTGVPEIPSLLVVFVVAPVVTGLLTLGIGWLLFTADLKGAYFAITTLIISIVFERIAGEFVGFFGGFNGIYNIPSLAIGSFEFPATLTYYVAAGVLIGVYLLAQRLVNSAFGRVMRGIRENEERTQFLGYDTQQYRLIVFTLSGVIAGLAGALYVTIDGFVSPPLLGFVLSTQVVIWIAVGGRGTLVGAVVGPMLIQYLNSTLSDVLLNFWELAIAILFIVVVIVAPRGLVGSAEQITANLRARASGGIGTSGDARSPAKVDTEQPDSTSHVGDDSDG